MPIVERHGPTLARFPAGGTAAVALIPEGMNFVQARRLQERLGTNKFANPRRRREPIKSFC